MKKNRHVVSGRKYVKDKKGDIRVNNNEIVDRWKKYFMVLLNERNGYELDKLAKIEGPLMEITEV